MGGLSQKHQEVFKLVGYLGWMLLGMFLPPSSLLLEVKRETERRTTGKSVLRFCTRRCVGGAVRAQGSRSCIQRDTRARALGEVTFGVLSTNLCFPSSPPSCAFISSSFATSFAIWRKNKEGTGGKPTCQAQPTVLPQYLQPQHSQHTQTPQP